MVLDASSQVGMRFVAFSLSLELLLRFLQQVGRDLHPSSVTFCNFCSFRAAHWIGQRSRIMTMPHCGWTGGKPGTGSSVLTSLSVLLVSSCTLLSLPRSHGFGGICTFSHCDVPLELLCSSNIFLSKIVLMDW